MLSRATGKYDLVICDIDGCLSPESHAPINGPALSEIAEHNRQAIQNRDRPVVTLCSGRPIGFVECLCRLIHNTLIPCIGENDAWIFERTAAKRVGSSRFQIADDPGSTSNLIHISISVRAGRSLQGQQIQHHASPSRVSVGHSSRHRPARFGGA